jgi:Na+-transporting NADH:ubiquinone oxidoreductase subunit NqrC
MQNNQYSNGYRRKYNIRKEKTNYKFAVVLFTTLILVGTIVVSKACEKKESQLEQKAKDKNETQVLPESYKIEAEKVMKYYFK